MLRKVAVMLVGAALALIVSFVGAGGCEEAQNAFNCADLCNRYQDCFDKTYDTSACEIRCESYANVNAATHDAANRCQNCLNQSACAQATAVNCPDCAGLIP
jgi:hypothetical protein